MSLDLSETFKIICKKCNKTFYKVPLKNKKFYPFVMKNFIKCCNKKKIIDVKDIIKIQHYNFKCPECNKKIECYYIDILCPFCGKSNTEKKCYKKPKGKPKSIDTDKSRRYY